jgi:peptide/nickel transport system substrate-binding protein
MKKFWLILCCIALLAAACGDDGDDDGAAQEGDGASPTTEADEAQPVAGGTLTMGMFAFSAGLDPVIQSGTGVAGGIELAALYDTLMRYNPETAEFEPRVAESLTPNDDFTQWTLKLRPGVKFTDGTAYDSAAVVTNLKRHIEKRSRTANLVTPITNYETPDATTVVFTLGFGWNGFPFALASAPGMIVSPTAIQTLGDQLALNPVGAGAGPFMFESFRANEAVVLKRNPDYWGGDVYLDQLRFVFITGADATYASLKTGDVQAAFIRDPAVIDEAKSDGVEGYEAVYSSGDTLLINNGVKVTCSGGQPAPVCTGQADGAQVPTVTPTSDVRLRRAVAAAIDRDVMNERVYGGKAKVGSGLMWEGSIWYSGIEGPEYDLDEAKRLVAEVKAEGKWDGSIRIGCHSGNPQWGTTVSTLLQLAGFTPTVNDQRDVQQNIAEVIVRKDYDLACFGTTISDEEPFFAINRDLNSALGGNAGNFAGYANPDVDQAIADGRAASTTEGKQEAIDTIATAFAEDVPFLTLGASTEFVAYGDGLRGVEPTVSTLVLFDKAWLEQ